MNSAAAAAAAAPAAVDAPAAAAAAASAAPAPAPAPSAATVDSAAPAGGAAGAGTSAAPDDGCKGVERWEAEAEQCMAGGSWRIRWPWWKDMCRTGGCVDGPVYCSCLSPCVLCLSPNFSQHCGCHQVLAARQIRCTTKNKSAAAKCCRRIGC